jgi:hypothetical protein
MCLDVCRTMLCEIPNLSLPSGFKFFRFLLIDRRASPPNQFSLQLSQSFCSSRIFRGLTSTRIRASLFCSHLSAIDTKCEVIVYLSRLSHNKLQYILYWWNYCPSRRQSIILIIHALLALTSSSGNKMTRKRKL